MRERAESVGGSIAWHSRPGAGTQVELHVPVGIPSWSSPLPDVAPSSETGRPAQQHQAVRSPAATTSEAD
jgi:hypothetical protein